MHGNVCNKYRKFKKIKMTYIFKKKLSAHINFEKCFKENNQLRY